MRWLEFDLSLYMYRTVTRKKIGCRVCKYVICICCKCMYVVGLGKKWTAVDQTHAGTSNDGTDSGLLVVAVSSKQQPAARRYADVGVT